MNFIYITSWANPIEPPKQETPAEFDFLNAFYPDNPLARKYFELNRRNA